MKQFEYFDLHHTAEGIDYHNKFWPSRYKNTIQNLLGALRWELICVSSMPVEHTLTKETCLSHIIYTYKREQINDVVQISAEESDILKHINQNKKYQHIEEKMQTLYRTFEGWAERTGFIPDSEEGSKRIENWTKRVQSNVLTWGFFGSKTITTVIYEQELKLTFHPDAIVLDVSYFEDGVNVHTLTEKFNVDQVELLKGFELKSSEEVNSYTSVQ